ncbi:ParB/RepB/Spo0J family partition protein [Cohnella sp. CFH 77786]|uniref:ParB/RepB/Spo0J family partition protein n=1 Tax=Cohnella sp. CFH 77786 TaxID=2662265 RepID=UPI001C6100F6|nr:ParB/RepB/Spo0J family partition protein [Cohnella sp. CFH 77786]MBW5448066.1 ParB/RepB/Spo0J family partition protein [Cohnella sp. CFH 77786]
MEMIELPLDLIDEDTDQPRYQFDDEAILELMNSIAELGLLSPIKVRTLENGRYKIIYGNRRYKASKNLGRATIPCIVSNVTDELEIYLEQIAENLTREGFSPIEEAEAFHKLMNDPRFTSSVKYLSSKLGKPEAYIKNKLELLKFDNKVKKLIVSGTDIRKDKLTEDQLLPLKDLPIEHRDSLALIVARDEMPVSDVKKIAKLFKDKDISASTKDKLLYKSGHELLATWSTYEMNRAERAKRAEPKEAPEEKPKAAKPVGEPAAPKAPMLETKLKKLLDSLPNDDFFPPEALEEILQKLDVDSREHFLNDINNGVERLEKQLSVWRKVKDMVSNH